MFKTIYNLVMDYWKDSVAKTSFISVTLIFCLIAIAYSAFSAFAVAFSYFLGCLVCWIIILYKHAIFKYIPQFGLLLGFKDIQKSSNNLDLKNVPKCDLCNNGKCLRHKPRPIKEPWNDLYVHKNLDNAIKQLYEKILKNFVTGWYQDICNDQRFEYAIKKSLKYATSILLRRVKQIDFPVLLMDKLLPVVLSHLHGVSKSMQNRKNLHINCKNNESISRNFVICAKPYVQHYALKDRDTEIEYVRLITEKLMPVLLDKEDHECRNFITLIREIFSCWVLLPLTDCLSDPSIINNIIISLFSNAQEYDENLKNKKILLLQDFCVLPKSLKFLQEKCTLAVLLKDSNKLYCFMKFLKRTDRINLLQFCLHIDEMNTLLMTPASSLLKGGPDRKQKHLNSLKISLQSIMSVYLQSNSSDHLMHFVTITPKQLRDIEAVTKIEPEKIGLSNVTPIYELYDKVFSYLDKLLKEFYTSPEFLEFNYGPKNQIEICKTSINCALRPRQQQNQNSHLPLQLSQSQFRLSNISTKIKGALRSGPVDGQFIPNSSFYAVEHTSNQNINYGKLSDYIVNVHSVEMSNGSQASEALFRVHCEIQAYALHYSTQNTMLPAYSQGHFSTPHNVMQTVKEKAFHNLRSEIGTTGEWDILPDSRTHSLEERRLSYEMFLQSLIANKSLSRKQQERIVNFLISPSSTASMIPANVESQLEENIISAGGLTTDGNIGANFYQSVAHKLRKERGQHLQCFTSSLFKSVQEYNTNSSSTNIADSPKSDILKRSSRSSRGSLNNKRFSTNRFSLVFGDHFRETQRFDTDEYFHCSIPAVVRGPSQCLLFLLVRLLSAPKVVIRIVLALSNFFGTFLDKIINSIVHRKLVESSEVCEIGLASLINTLIDTLFPTTKAEKSIKSEIISNNTLLYETAKQKIKEFSETKKFSKYWPNLSSNLIEIHQAMQHPTLNKQLVYNLFDIAIVEIFPELNTNS